eukprot:1133716-Pelagomonas_calceolata.AAC.4
MHGGAAQHALGLAPFLRSKPAHAQRTGCSVHTAEQTQLGIGGMAQQVRCAEHAICESRGRIAAG